MSARRFSVPPMTAPSGQRARAVELYLAGASTYEVGDVLGIAHSTVERWLEAEDVPRRRRGPRVPPDVAAAIERRRARVAELYRAGVSTAEISAQLGISVARVYVDLDAAGVVRGRPGPPTLYPEHDGPRTCENCGRTFNAKPSRVARGFGNFCSLSCRSRHRWQVTGRGISSAMLENASALAGVNVARRFKGLWASRRPPAPGGRNRGRPRADVGDDSRRLVLRLKRERPDWGERSLALAAGLSRRQVRQILRAS